MHCGTESCGEHAAPDVKQMKSFQRGNCGKGCFMNSVADADRVRYHNGSSLTHSTILESNCSVSLKP